MARNSTPIIQFQSDDRDEIRLQKLRRLADEVATIARTLQTTTPVTPTPPSSITMTGPAVLGRLTGTGAPLSLTGAQVTSLLDVFTAGNKGVVPAPGTAFGNRFLRDDGGWATVTVAANSILHADLAGLTADDHPQYTEWATAETITGQWQFSSAIWGADGTAALPQFTFTADIDTGIYRVGLDTLGVTTSGQLRLSVSDTAITSTLPLQGQDGTAALPAYSFSVDTDTGGYRIGADNWGLATGGVLRFNIDTANVTSTLPFLAPAGTAALPSHSFSGDPNTGAYSAGADTYGISTNGTLRLSVSTAAVTSTLQLLNQDGTAALPAYSFTSDPNTGVYNVTADTLGLTTGGVLRYQIGPAGQLGTGGATYGTPGDALTSMGASTAPVWGGPNVGTGVTYGGALTGVGTSTIQVAAGKGVIFDNTTPSNPTFTVVTWGAQSIPVTGTAVHYVSVNAAGTASETTTAPTNSSYRTAIQLGPVATVSNTITSIGTRMTLTQQVSGSIYDIWDSLGVVKRGLDPQASGANLFLKIASGDLFSPGINMHVSSLSPNTSTSATFDTAGADRFRLVTQTTFGVVDTQSVPVANYDNAGVITAVPGPANRATIFSVYRLINGGVRVLYGQAYYNDLATATAALGSYTPIVPTALSSNAVLLGYLIARADATALNNPAQALFVTTDRFGTAKSGIAVSGSVPASNVTYDNTTSGLVATNAQAAIDELRTGPSRVSDGTVALPAYSWLADTDTGIYRIGANTMGFSSGGVLQLEVDGSYVDAKGQWRQTGVNSPAQLVANTNDWAATTGAYSVVRFSTDASRNITGAAGGVSGRHVIFINVGTQPAVFTNEDTNSTAANRFLNGGGGSKTLAANASITYRYDGASNRWRELSDTASATVDQTAAYSWTGQHTWTQPLQGPDGVVGTPAFTFSLDTNTGVYRIGADQMGLAANGVLQQEIGNSYIANKTQVRWDGSTTPATITSNTNNWTATAANVTRVLFSTDATRTITGATGGVDGRIIIFTNVGSFSAIFTYNDTNSSAGNRFFNIDSLARLIPTGGSITYIYEQSGGGGAGGWRETNTNPSPVWTDVTFQNSWVNFGSGTQNVQYAKDASGFVYLRGTLKSGTFDATAFNLPPGFRPPAQLISTQLGSTVTSTGAVRVDVGTTGNVTVFTTTGITNSLIAINLVFHTG